MTAPSFEFDWDPAKAQRNDVKHGVRFEEAMMIFTDPLTLTMFDEDHSDDEERWITMGTTQGGRLLAVIHTYDETDATRVVIRIISARSATKRETRQYREES
jgi:uncharacterized DUF497 family protein